MLSLKFLDLMVKQIDVIAESELDKLLDQEDLQSAYYLKNIIIHKLAITDEVKVQEILEDLIFAVNSIYEEFISDDKFEGGDKEKEKEKPKEADSSDDEDNTKKEDSIKTKVIRKRGRPKKLLIPKKFTLKKAKQPL